MNFDFIIKRALGLITSPNQEWNKIKEEKADIVSLFVNYAIILAAIPALAGFIGWVVIGKSFGFGTIRMPIGKAIMFLVFTYIFALLGAFLLGLVIDALATTFGAKKDLNESVKISVYAFTIAWLGGVFNLIPAIAVLGLLVGLYSLYLIYLGIKTVKSPPKDKEVPYFVVTLISYIVITVILGMIISQIIFGTTSMFI